MHRADVNEVQLEYEVSDAGDPIIFIHGAFVSDSFGPLLAEPSLAGRYRLIRYRRRGYAGTKPVLEKTPITAEQQAADCAALLRYLGIERTHVVGHSFGGCMPQRFAMPQRTLRHAPTLGIVPSSASARAITTTGRRSLVS